MDELFRLQTEQDRRIRKAKDDQFVVDRCLEVVRIGAEMIAKQQEGLLYLGLNGIYE